MALPPFILEEPLMASGWKHTQAYTDINRHKHIAALSLMLRLDASTMQSNSSNGEGKVCVHDMKRLLPQLMG